MAPALYFRVMHGNNALPTMEVSFFDSVLAWFKEVGVSKRRTQAGTSALGLMGEVHQFETALCRPSL
jgi:hypothetical protein